MAVRFDRKMPDYVGKWCPQSREVPRTLSVEDIEYCAEDDCKFQKEGFWDLEDDIRGCGQSGDVKGHPGSCRFLGLTKISRDKGIILFFLKDFY